MNHNALVMRNIAMLHDVMAAQCRMFAAVIEAIENLAGINESLRSAEEVDWLELIYHYDED